MLQCIGNHAVVIKSVSKAIQQSKVLVARNLTGGSRWGNALLRRTRRFYENPNPVIPTYETFTRKDLSRLRYDRINPLPPIWQSRRSPLIGYKVGVLPMWDEWGRRFPCTIVKLDRLIVMETHNKSRHGREGMRMGLGVKHPSKAIKSEIGEAIKLGINVKDVMKSTDCSSDCILPRGFRPSVRHFCPGQWVMVGAITRRKQFQGAIKRWHLKCGRRSHHHPKKKRRSRGSCGAGGPAVKKRNLTMAGHSGGIPRNVLAKVFRIETFRNLVFLNGITPGKAGCSLTIHDARGRGWVRNRNLDISWPTFIPEPNVSYPVTQQCPPSTKDPFLYPDRPFMDKK